jgi:phosphoribosylformylglycinamidine cyclo-ligase
MPDTYLPDVLDVAGCMIGTVSDGAVLDGSRVRAGDVLIGLASDGLHTNGYSLARRVLAESRLPLDRSLPGGAGETLGESLLSPHRWYGPALRGELEERPGARSRVHALAHVTGGGIVGNLARVMPEGARARVDPGAWPRPALFGWLIETGRIPEDDAREAFNLGIGMVVVGAPEDAASLARDLTRAGERCFEIGRVVAGERGAEWKGAP